MTLKPRIKWEALPVLPIFLSFENVTVDKIAKKTCVIHCRCRRGVQ